MSCSPSSSDVGSKTRRPVEGKRHQMSVCQVTGCGVEVDENQARRLKTCEPHRRALTVDMDGVPSRFCQQCTLIHPLNHFDGAKRGCRRRLELRNSRRQQRTASRRGPSSEPGTPGTPGTPASSSANSTPMKTDSSTPMKSVGGDDSPQESQRPFSMLGRTKSTPTSFPPQEQHMANADARIPHARDERPPWAWQGFPSGPSAAANPPRFASMTPEDFDNALSSMQWSQSRELGMFGRPMRGSISDRPMRGSISDGLASLSPADRMMFLRLPSLPDIPFVEAWLLPRLRLGSSRTMQSPPPLSASGQHRLVPFAVEESGRFGQHALALLREIAARGVKEGFLKPPSS